MYIIRYCPQFMTLGNRETNPGLIHPREKYLVRRLNGGGLPVGADELLREAIEEYQWVFKVYRESGSRRLKSEMGISLPDDGENRLLAGRIHTLTVQFGQPVEKIEEVFAHLAVGIRPRNMDGVAFYPDWIRYPAIDVKGNSRPIRFMLLIPDSLRGYSGGIDVLVFNGGRCAAASSLNFELV